MGRILSLYQQKTVRRAALSPLLACPSAGLRTGPGSEPRMVSLQTEGGPEGYEQVQAPCECLDVFTHLILIIMLLQNIWPQ